MSEDKISRREFLKKAGLIGVGVIGVSIFGDEILGLMSSAEAATQSNVMAIAKKGTPSQLVNNAVNALGGIGKFVKKGQSVCIKPNLAWDTSSSGAANVNPDVLLAVIQLCEKAGASRITVIEHSCDNASATFKSSGAQAVVAKTKARLISADKESYYKEISIPKGKTLKKDKILKDILSSDVFINLPICKVHGGSIVTASMKNLMGATWDRGYWHRSGLHQCIADLSTVIKPNLIILDAVNILLTNGPKGPGEIKKVNQVIAGTDPVAIDTYAAKLLGKDPKNIDFIKAAVALNIGTMDLTKVTTKNV